MKTVVGALVGLIGTFLLMAGLASFITWLEGDGGMGALV